MSLFSFRSIAKITSVAAPVAFAAPVALVVLLGSSSSAHAASRTTGVGFQGLQSTVAIGLGIPHAAAIDAAGNVYVTDLINSKVLKVPRGTSSANCTVAGSCTQIGSGFTQPSAVAVDASGNVFVTDAATESLYKVTPAGAQTVLASGLVGVSGVALAADGTVYLAISGNINRVSPAGVLSHFATGPAQPGGIAVAANGNVYLADISDGSVLQYTPAGVQTTFVSGLSSPQSVALDGTGNLYISDTGNNRILTVPATGPAYVCPADCTVLALQVGSPSGIASDASGNVYVADTGHQQLVKLTQDADFGASPIVASNANPAASLTLNYLLYGSSCASPPTVSVLTRGAANRDFTATPSASVCTPGTPDSLAVTVNFAPLSPGLRTGSVQFLDATGVPQVGTYLHGVGKGPLITWTPGVITAAITSSGP